MVSMTIKGMWPLLLAGLGWPGAAHAVDKSATLGVNALVLPSCVAGSTGTSNPGQFDTLDFGTHFSLANTLKTTGGTGSGALRINCVANVPYRVLISPGNSGNTTARSLVGPGNATILYNLYTSASYATVWDNVTGISAMGTGANQWLPIYGRVPAQSTPTPGIYTDTLTVTVVW
ncbi:spore coat U domain-containing protein [Pseudomonas sp. RIT-PI-AD]|uniref:Csu type fimbrial protein n=1 Tax=Pseudomonas sp. RIT-PI-AD TaxID=3035294 RepID=UPI0021D8BF0C|nr:spore coat U domain-containing protein [Pseudomonas sp. RIT-PI-AD]